MADPFLDKDGNECDFATWDAIYRAEPRLEERVGDYIVRKTFKGVGGAVWQVTTELAADARGRGDVLKRDNVKKYYAAKADMDTNYTAAKSDIQASKVRE